MKEKLKVASFHVGTNEKMDKAAKMTASSALNPWIISPQSLTHSHLPQPGVASLKDATRVHAAAEDGAASLLSLAASECKISTGQLPGQAGALGSLGWKVQSLGEAIPGGENAVPSSTSLVLSVLPEKGIIYLVPELYEKSLASGLWGSLERMVQKHVAWRGPRKNHDVDKGKWGSKRE